MKQLLDLRSSSIPCHEIDRIERQVMQFEMERQALEKESDDASAARLEKVIEEMADLKEESATLMARWRNEKDVIDVVREAQERIEELRNEAEQAQRLGNLNRASEITYGTLPELKKTSLMLRTSSPTCKLIHVSSRRKLPRKILHE